jgi:uncharacterized OB-fold protein
MNAVTEAIPDIRQPYLDGLKAGKLMFQRCKACGNAWLPARSECPKCLSPDCEWVAASGDATLVSWVVYHRAFNEAFKTRVPYTVAVVQLNEGARMISNVVGADPTTLKIDQALKLQIDREGEVFVPRFKAA